MVYIETSTMRCLADLMLGVQPSANLETRMFRWFSTGYQVEFECRSPSISMYIYVWYVVDACTCGIYAVNCICGMQLLHVHVVQ